jgi:cytidylate kinase
MAIVTVSGEPGCRHEEVARLAAQRLHFELVTELRLKKLIAEEYAETASVPDRAHAPLAASVLAHMATDAHLVVSAPGAEFHFKNVPGVLRSHFVAPDNFRIGTLMLERRIDRKAAHELLRDMDRQHRQQRRLRSGRAGMPLALYDVVLNMAGMNPEQMAAVVEAAAQARGLTECGFLSAGAEAQLQFQFRLQLAKHGITPTRNVRFRRAEFVHPSEEIFANLLDFYRIAWEYEPRSFPIQWDKEGRVSEAFTPDFYLPEYDLYVELTTMKQSLVTKKNRKVKLMRMIYPEINIQVFYQKDFQDLVFKYGLTERPVKV